ncbi:MAG: tRNA (adenosine(37)-N6)-threonylcarbamoyltransferase complex dimerization subunit type 1 TsaB [Acidobacteriota bacterium]|nr:tRNA (adenosine(37)-N6)-threonylcarbamoyltransferase complex dimerization subunit type 1 TsaB [Blastocatellia bacterium]MDW8240224.1 tRNA (adenosine(37)-N6)-threonylcarbamoyltransferase complex dimerization subunit type 1 TsaB [Acidobacteriota bacterium]
MSNQGPSDFTADAARSAAAPLILAVDTTSRRRSVAIARGTQALGMLAVDAVATHSWQLHEEIDLLLRKLSLNLNQIDLFGVTVGPGSFTGVRVGLSTIKGFAHSLNKPVVGVSSLAAHARAAGTIGLVCVCLDALRGEVYAQLFDVHQDGTVESLTDPSLALPGLVYASLIDEPTLTLIGDGVLASLDVLQDEAATARKNIIISPFIRSVKDAWVVIQDVPYLAPAVVALTVQEAERGHSASAAELLALYVRPADAELKRRY